MHESCLTVVSLMNLRQITEAHNVIYKIAMGNTGNCQTKKKRKFDTVVQSPLLISILHMKNTKQQT